MKRIVRLSSGPTLPALLEYAASFDEAKLSLDSYEIQSLLQCLASKAKHSLTGGTELRYRGVRVHKAAKGSVSVRLACRNISYSFRDTAA